MRWNHYPHVYLLYYLHTCLFTSNQSLSFVAFLPEFRRTVFICVKNVYKEKKKVTYLANLIIAHIDWIYLLSNFVTFVPNIVIPTQVNSFTIQFQQICLTTQQGTYTRTCAS